MQERVTVQAHKQLKKAVLHYIPFLNLCIVIILIDISVIKILHDQFSGLPTGLSNLKKHFPVPSLYSDVGHSKNHQATLTAFKFYRGCPWPCQLIYFIRFLVTNLIISSTNIIKSLFDSAYSSLNAVLSPHSFSSLRFALPVPVII